MYDTYQPTAMKCWPGVNIKDGPLSVKWTCMTPVRNKIKKIPEINNLISSSDH